MSLRTLEKLLGALDCVIRIDIVPTEMRALCSFQPRWWKIASDFHQVGTVTLSVPYKPIKAIPEQSEDDFVYDTTPKTNLGRHVAYQSTSVSYRAKLSHTLSSLVSA